MDTPVFRHAAPTDYLKEWWTLIRQLASRLFAVDLPSNDRVPPSARELRTRLGVTRWCQERPTREQGSASCLHATQFPSAQCSADWIAEPGTQAGPPRSVVAAVAGQSAAVDCVDIRLELGLQEKS
jgi:hypothetical protein